VINEPDLKLPGMHDPKNFSKGIISAIDGMLDAEKEMNMIGPGVNFTAVFSFGVCSTCSEFKTRPSLGQMSELKAAMLAPETVGYQPHNNLGEFYRTRFHNSFNTNNPAEHVKSMFLDEYEHAFPATPVMIQEYHNPHQGVHQDLRKILEIAEASPLLNGISFFEFHVRYDKGGTEMDFGMLKLGNFSVADFSYFGDGFQAWCLTPHKRNGELMPDALAEAYGGERLDFDSLCTPNTEKVPLTAAGFQNVHSQNDERKAVFVDRLVKHLGGSVRSQDSFRTFVASFSSTHASKKGPRTQFDNLVEALLSKPSWAMWNDSASCVADRDSHAPAVGNAIGAACGGLTTFDCDEIPDACRKSVWDVADYVFGIYFAEHKGSALQSCYFDGAATLAGTPQRMSEGKPECVIPVTWKPKRRLEALLTDGNDNLPDVQDSRLAMESSIIEEESEEAPSFLAPAMLGCLAAAVAVSLLIACGFPRPRSRPAGKIERQVSSDVEKVPSRECLVVKVVTEAGSDSPTNSSPNSDIPCKLEFKTQASQPLGGICTEDVAKKNNF